MNEPSQSPLAHNLPWRKKLCFAAFVVLSVACLTECALWAVGVRPLLADQDPFVGFSAQAPLFVPADNDTSQMVTAQNKLPWFNAQSFPSHKADGTYRIFTLGGSTTFGRPYDDRTSFSGWLRELLPAVDSRHDWEVINAGGISYASHRVVRVMAELTQYEPDLFIVYCGHNEHLEERTYRKIQELPPVIRELKAWLGHSRSYAVLHRLLRRDSDNLPISGGTEKELAPEVKTRLDNGIGPAAFSRDDKLSEDLTTHYKFNLKQMVQIANAAGATIIFVTPASNLSDCEPFKSQHVADVAAHDIASWEQHRDAAVRARDGADLITATAEIDDAARIAPRHAHTRYLQGQIHLASGDIDGARRAFVAASTEDVCPLRATGAIIDALKSVASDAETQVVDAVAVIDLASPNGIPGKSLFLDHVHPTIEGHRLIAEAILGAMLETRVVRRSDHMEEIWSDVAARVEAKVDRKMQGEALRNLSKVLGWAGKTDESNRLALQAESLLGGDVETEYLAGNALLEQNRVTEAITKFEAVLHSEPTHTMALNSLGTAQLKLGQFDAALRSFEQVIKLQPDFAPAHNNLGMLHQQTGDLAAAQVHYQQAIELNPKYANAFNNLGVLYRKQEQWQAAIAAFQRALETNDQFAEAQFNWGLTLQLQGDVEGALAHYETSLRIDRNYAPAHTYLGIVQEARGQWQAAAASYRKALEIPGAPIEAPLRMSFLLAACPDATVRNGNVALSLAQQCVRATGGKDGDAVSAVALAHAERGEFDRAIKIQQRAVELSPPPSRALQVQRLQSLQARRPWRIPSAGR
ncbi:MAG: tetratricopeptide repeat protein [Planctomycetales bacterium]|nr:tetratricopeptide repeat protein [Planctomycetales bacterium]